MVYLGTLADRFSFAELVGANLIAGMLLLALGLFGLGSRIMKWLPLPIVMGMFGGSILKYVIRMVVATVQDTAVAGTAAVCYLLGRVINSPRCPLVGLAVIGGGIAVAINGTASPHTLEWTLPVLLLPDMEFSVSSIVAVSLPMTALAMGLGNIQGLGFLMAQGYKVPINAVSTAVGISSVANALLGGHPATVARTGVAILASPDAGPAGARYWAAVIAAVLTLILAVAATPIAAALSVVPKTYIVTIAGLAILSSFQDAVEKSFTRKMRVGALVAFVIAATPFERLGITSAFWAIIAGICASALTERQQLLDFWNSGNHALAQGNA